MGIFQMFSKQNKVVSFTWIRCLLNKNRDNVVINMLCFSVPQKHGILLNFIILMGCI